MFIGKKKINVKLWEMNRNQEKMSSKKKRMQMMLIMVV